MGLALLPCATRRLDKIHEKLPSDTGTRSGAELRHLWEGKQARVAGDRPPPCAQEEEAKRSTEVSRAEGAGWSSGRPRRQSRTEQGEGATQRKLSQTRHKDPLGPAAGEHCWELQDEQFPEFTQDWKTFGFHPAEQSSLPEPRGNHLRLGKGQAF